MRNIGNITEQEQEKLINTKIGIAGTGGVGGAAVMNLVRMGIGHFNIADPETFTHSDINRQQGSGAESIGQKKVQAIENALKAINPSVDIKAFPEGLNTANLDSFLEGVSIVIDGLDFFCLPVRKAMFDRCRQKGLYILSAPIFGFGTSQAVFSPSGPTFDEFFGPIPEKIGPDYYANFGRSFFPRFPRYINLKAYIEAMRRGRPIPSFATSCALSGAVTALESILILLDKRKPVCAPMIRHYDLFDCTINTLDSRKKKINPLKKWLLKKVLLKDKQMQEYKDFLDKL